MLRGDLLICGTSTTGTGTLTLAATPTPPGGVDFDVFARATGIGFGNSAAVLVSYTIIEYTDSTFATTKAHEKGVGTLTLGGSSGIANCTLARTTKQTSATSLQSQPATQNIAPGTGISIGTAANTLVFIGVSAADTLVGCPYYDSASSTSGLYGAGTFGVGSTASTAAQNGAVYYVPFYWVVPMLVKRIKACTGSGTYSGTSNIYGALYAVGTDGRPGKLLIDFGALGTNPFGSTFNFVTSAAHANGFWLGPGFYWAALFIALSGGTGTVDLMTSNGAAWGQAIMGGNGVNSSFVFATASATANPAPDTANNTGYFGFQSNGGSPFPPIFMLAP